MRLPLLTAALMVAAPLGLASAQVSAVQSPIKNPAPKGPPVKVINPSVQPVQVVHSLGGSDDCSTAAVNDAISGPGNFAANTTTATTGSPVGTCGAIGNDVWYYWTATTSGVASITTCGLIGSDSAIAVWADGMPAGSCPTSQIACNDDACGLQTRVTWPVTAGSKYFLEVGGFAGTQWSGSFDITISVPPANDNCATPTVIAGAGPHAFDNTLASTGTQGQAEGICTFFSSTAIVNDVWFTWTSPFTGVARVDNCGGSIDTKMAAYAGAGCPAGAALGCNDDACGLQTRLDFNAVAGNTYTIQVGLYPFTTAGGAGSFVINNFVPPMNDSCTTPTAVVGNGPHNFDTTTNTTGVEGQNEPLCFAFGTSALYNDGWFTWVAGTTSTYEISLCGSSSYDTRVAVYGGSGCPTGAALACNDDSCGLVSAACFSAVSGQTYTIQIGGFSAAASGTGTFLLTPVASNPMPCAPTDDGTSDNSVGLNAGGAIVWFTGFGAIGQNVTVASVSTTYGTPLFPGGYTPSSMVTVAVWEDPNDDGIANDLVLVSSTSAAVSPGSIDTDIFQTIMLGAPANVSGIYFVGASVVHGAGQFPAPLDQSGSGGSVCGSGPGSWVAGDTTGTIDLANMNAANVPPQTIASAGLPGNWLVRPECGPGVVGTAYCFGDGTGAACPCANTGAAGNGCANSINAGGANLAASGSPVIGADTLVLQGSGMPNSSALYFQGTAQLSVAFGDGLRCVGGTIIRLGTKLNSGGASQYPGVGNQPVSIRGMVPSGATREYQVWYRNAAAFCTVSTFNLSNGLEIVW